MSLTWREKRALRAIDRYLTKQDPSLTARLQGPPAPAAPARVRARSAWSFFCLSLRGRRGRPQAGRRNCEEQGEVGRPGRCRDFEEQGQQGLAVLGDCVEQDPSLAARPQGPPAPAAPTTVLAKLAWLFFGLSIVLGVSGLVLGDAALQTGAGLVLVSFPPLVLLMAAVFRCK